MSNYFYLSARNSSAVVSFLSNGEWIANWDHMNGHVNGPVDQCVSNYSQHCKTFYTKSHHESSAARLDATSFSRSALYPSLSARSIIVHRSHRQYALLEICRTGWWMKAWISGGIRQWKPMHILFAGRYFRKTFDWFRWRGNVRVYEAFDRGSLIVLLVTFNSRKSVSDVWGYQLLYLVDEWGT